MLTSDRAGIETRVRAVIADVFGLSPEAAAAVTAREEVEGWDSLQHLTVVLSLEEEFDIHLDDEETVSLVTVPLIVATVEDHLREASPASADPR